MPYQNPPKVSIVLPTYNGSRYLRESISSCLEQSFSDFELLVVDDCSTDNTQEILQSISDPRLRVIRLEQNRKLPGALNAGLEQARGNYHTWTSDDNRYLPGALARMVDFLERNARLDGVYTDTYRLLDETRVGRWHSGPAYHLTKMQIIGACFLYRSCLWERVGRYDETAFLVEDYDWWVRAWKSGARLTHLAEVWYEYRIHENSLGESHGHSVVDDKKISVRNRHFGKLELAAWKLWCQLRRLALYFLDREKFSRERWIGQTEPLERPELGKGSQTS